MYMNKISNFIIIVLNVIIVKNQLDMFVKNQVF